MSQNSAKTNQIIIFAGLGFALLIAIILSPFASKDPDGLDRVAQDLKFDHKAIENPPAQQLPFAQIFDEYSFKAIKDQKLATSVAGLIGTVVTFGMAYGLGKLATKTKTSESQPQNDRLTDD
jgi:cobalt/nickel transport protein